MIKRKAQKLMGSCNEIYLSFYPTSYGGNMLPAKFIEKKLFCINYAEFQFNYVIINMTVIFQIQFGFFVGTEHFKTNSPAMLYHITTSLFTPMYIVQ